MVDVPVQRYDLFLQASRLLQHYRQQTPELKAVGVELALCIQHYRTHHPDSGQLPWVGAVSGSGTGSQGMPIHQLTQEICEPFFSKSHPQLPGLPESSEPLIWPLFNQGEDGLIRPLLPNRRHGKPAELRWFKACNSQEGLGCHALAAHLWQDQDFLASDRDLCSFRLYDGRYPFSVDQGRQTCGFDDHPCGWQAGFPKMLQVVGKGSQAAVLQAPWTHRMWQMLVPETHLLPTYPVLVALYFGNAALIKGRTHLDAEQMRQDLGFSVDEFQGLFDSNPHSWLNAQLLQGVTQLPPEILPAPAWQIPTLNRAQPSGGKVILDPDEPPHFRSSGIPGGAPLDPLMAERRRRRQLERTPRHNEILSHFRRWFRLAGLEVREDQHFFDFLAVAQDRVILAEVKLVFHRDMAEGIQETIGQLLYYERFSLQPWTEHGFQVHKAAVFDQPPLGDYIDFLTELGIATYWLTDTHEIDGREDSLRLLRQLDVQIRPDPEFGEF